MVDPERRIRVKSNMMGGSKRGEGGEHDFVFVKEWTDAINTDNNITTMPITHTPPSPKSLGARNSAADRRLHESWA